MLPESCGRVHWGVLPSTTRNAVKSPLPEMVVIRATRLHVAESMTGVAGVAIEKVDDHHIPDRIEVLRVKLRIEVVFLEYLQEFGSFYVALVPEGSRDFENCSTVKLDDRFGFEMASMEAIPD